MKDYRQLNVWKSGHALALEIYRHAKSLPKDELYALTSQIRRAACSVPANSAEGCGREGDAELKRFLNIALGSACELDYHLLLSTDLGYLEPAAATSLSAQVLQLRRMLGAFIRKIKGEK